MLSSLPSPFTPAQEVRGMRRAHWVQLAVAHVVLVLAIVRMILRMNRIGINLNAPQAGGTASGLGTGVAVKSIVFILYQIITEHGRFRRWASLKANMILNLIDGPFWIGLVVITASNMNTCVSPMCEINGVIIGFSIVLFLIGMPVAYFSVKHFVEFRRTGMRPDDAPLMKQSHAGLEAGQRGPRGATGYPPRPY